MVLRKVGAGSIAIGACLLVTATASAQFSAISGPASGELSHAQILEGIYGGLSFTDANIQGTGLVSSFSASGNDYVSAGLGITATRISDTGGGILDLGLPAGSWGGASDQVWQDGTIRFRASARYASFAQDFGYLMGDGAGDDSTAFAADWGANGTTLMSAQGGGFLDPSLGDHNATTMIASGNPFRWVRDGGGGPHSSVEENNDGSDRMVTYEITGTGIQYPTFLLFYEDLNDWDYNDLVIQLSVIPLPAPLAMGLIGLAGVGLLRRRRMKTHA